MPDSFETRDGLQVRSASEKRIADWLSRNDIAFEYEPMVGGFRPDFLLPGLGAAGTVVEYWGGAGFGAYQEQMVKKTEAFEAAGYQLIHLMPIHLWELEAELARQISRIQSMAD